MEDRILELEAKCSRFEALIEMQDHKIEKLYSLMNRFSEAIKDNSEAINSNSEKTEILIKILKKFKGE